MKREDKRRTSIVVGRAVWQNVAAENGPCSSVSGYHQNAPRPVSLRESSRRSAYHGDRIKPPPRSPQCRLAAGPPSARRGAPPAPVNLLLQHNAVDARLEQGKGQARLALQLAQAVEDLGRGPRGQPVELRGQLRRVSDRDGDMGLTGACVPASCCGPGARTRPGPLAPAASAPAARGGCCRCRRRRRAPWCCWGGGARGRGAKV